MPMPRKPTPLRFCEFCAKKLERKRLPSGKLEALFHFTRRKFCDQQCMARDFSRRPSPGKTSWSACHQEAREVCPPGPCAKCGKKRAEVHHKDEDWTNNSPGNLQRLCRGCHIKEHRGKGQCSIAGCSAPHKGHGYCDKHYQRFKRWGDPLAFKRNQHTPLIRKEV